MSYIIDGLRSLVLDGWVWDKLAICALVILVTGALLTTLSVRAMRHYDE